MRIGVLGGTFDPIHVGHLAAARAAIECGGLDRVVFVPTREPPHRSAAVAGARHRLEMTRLAVDSEKALEVSDLEIRRGGISYTADTLKELKDIHPRDELFLILGWDAARMFATWRVPDEIRRLATVVVVTRPGSGEPDSAALRSAGLDPRKTMLCARQTPDISGSGRGDAIAKGDRGGARLPQAVLEYIARNRLYADNQ